MKEQFVSYEIAVKLKEKGFKEKCLASHDKTYGLGIDMINPLAGIDWNSMGHLSAPLWQQAIDWLYQKDVIVYWEMDITMGWWYNIGPAHPDTILKEQKWFRPNDCYSHPNQAREAAILKTLELI